MLKDSMKQTTAFHAFLNTQPLPKEPRDIAQIAWNAACLWQRNQDTQIVNDVNPFEKDDLVKAILTQHTIKVDDIKEPSEPCILHGATSDGDCPRC